MSLKLDIYSKAIAATSLNDSTRHSYYRNSERFSKWVSNNKEDLPSRQELRTDPARAQEALQKYSDYLVSKNYTPATVHTYLAAPCKGLGVDMRDIDKPVRSAGSIVRSRGDLNPQSKAEIQNEENQRLVEAQAAIGIRRSELADLRGCDLRSDESGYTCVYVESGKGGKEQYQRILPDNLEKVKDLFRDLKPNEPIFSKQEMNNKIDLHALRAENARSAYDYYLGRLSTEHNYRDQLREELVARWDSERQDARPEQREKFVNSVYNDNLIYLRESQDNYARAVEDDRPTAYDRTATLAVSVFHLSHWRCDVTITNYLV